SELSVADTATVMQTWRAHADALVDRPEKAEPTRSLHLSETLEARFDLSGSFDTEGGSLIATAIRLASTPDTEAEPARSPAERRADAFVDVCRFFLDHQRTHRGGRHRPHLNVSIRLEDLEAGLPGRVVGGGPLDNETIRRLLCDAG